MPIPRLVAKAHLFQSTCDRPAHAAYPHLPTLLQALSYLNSKRSDSYMRGLVSNTVFGHVRHLGGGVGLRVPCRQGRAGPVSRFLDCNSKLGLNHE